MRLVAFVISSVVTLAACSSSDSADGNSSGATPPASSSEGSPATTSGGTTDGGTTTPPNDGTGLTTYGDAHAGEYELGPVEWTGSFNNSCSPYASSVESQEGLYLAGLGTTFNGDGTLCDACIIVKTAKSKSLVLRVVTNGETTAPNNIDVSQEAYALLNLGEYPRSMTWQVVDCPDTGKLAYQFQTEASVDWTSLWVRNPRAPIAKVEVKSANHAAFFELTRGNDGTLTDNGGFGAGSFTLRITSMSGQTITDTFPSFDAGALVASGQQFN